MGDGLFITSNRLGTFSVANRLLGVYWIPAVVAWRSRSRGNGHAVVVLVSVDDRVGHDGVAFGSGRQLWCGAKLQPLAAPPPQTFTLNRFSTIEIYHRVKQAGFQGFADARCAEMDGVPYGQVAGIN
jgi:hypothetical protein